MEDNQSQVTSLVEMGFTQGEAKVYVALLYLGSTTVGSIVKKSGVANSNVYAVLTRLLIKGMISSITKGKVKYYQAVPPLNLFDYFDKEESKIKQQREKLSLLLPQFEKIQSLVPFQKAEMFIGLKGLKTAYQQHLAGKKHENLFFYIHNPRYAQESDLFYFSILPFYKAIRQRGITNKLSLKSPWFKKVNKIKNFMIKYVDFPIPGNIEISGNSILLISWDKPVISVIIESSDLADNLKEYFNAVWKLGKK